MEPTFEASVGQLLSKAPAPVRMFILNELPQKAQELMGRHGLHIDQGSALESELFLLLVGQSTPTEFVNGLTDAGIDGEKIKLIATDVNNEIFMRLQKEERTEATPKPAAPVAERITAAPPVPVKASLPIYSPASAPVHTAPAAPPEYITRAVAPAPVQKQVPPPPVLPGQMPEPVVAPRPTPPPPPRIEIPEPPKQVAPAADPHDRIIHTMARDMQAMKSGTDPMRVAHPAPPAWATAPAAKPVAPPAPAPTPTPVQAPQPIAPAVPKPAALPETPHHPQALTHHLKQYGVDPYREPVE